MSKDSDKRETAQEAAKRRLAEEDRLAAEAKRPPETDDPFPDVSKWVRP